MEKVKILVLILIVCLVIILVLQADKEQAAALISGGKGLDMFRNHKQMKLENESNEKYNMKLPDPPKIKPKPKPTIIIDGLNYIHGYLNHEPITDANMLVSYPNIINVWKCINVAAREYEAKKNNIIFVLKNQDGYKMSEYEKKLYEALAKRLKIQIHVAYDPSPIDHTKEHYMSGRDDKYINDLKIELQGKDPDVSVEVISKDKYRDAVDFDKINKFEVFKFG